MVVLKLLSRTSLKAQRLKPSLGQEPAKRVLSRRCREHIEYLSKQLTLISIRWLNCP